MNKVILMGRLTDDPKISMKDGEISNARYTLAVDRSNEGADFISCVCFKKAAEFVSRFLKKGTKIAIEGRIQTGSYTKQDGSKVYTTDVIVDRHEFCESKKDATSNNVEDPVIPDGISDIQEELPFK